MAKGTLFAPERSEFTDVETGARVQQLTNFKGNSHHLYFTNSGWYDHGRKLLFGSDRDNATNLFGLDLDSGEIRQLTGAAPGGRAGGFLSASVNPVKDEAYFWRDGRVIALDIHTLEERELYRVSEKFIASGYTNVTADGRYVCIDETADMDEYLVGLLGPAYKRMSLYPGFVERCAARPRSRVIRIPLDGTAPEVVWEEDNWIGHINTSPGQANLLTFCHEGPWDQVDHRVWGLDIDSGQAWKIRPTEPGERVGHEYWQADGEHVGFHGTRPDGSPFLGSIRFDNSELMETEIAVSVQHCHSNHNGLVAADGNRDHPQLMLWPYETGATTWSRPRVLHTHRGSFHVQHVHAHPRFSAAGDQIVFTSDHSGYGNVFLADVPDPDTLPFYRHS